MRLSKNLALAGLLLLAGVAPSLAQGVYATPPSPNSAQSMPQPPDSAPPGARTLAPGSTGTQQIGTIGTAQPEPKTDTASQAPAPR